MRPGTTIPEIIFLFALRFAKFVTKGNASIVGNKKTTTKNRTYKGPESKSAIGWLHTITE